MMLMKVPLSLVIVWLASAAAALELEDAKFIASMGNGCYGGHKQSAADGDLLIVSGASSDSGCMPEYAWLTVHDGISEVASIEWEDDRISAVAANGVLGSAAYPAFWAPPVARCRGSSRSRSSRSSSWA